MKKILTFLFFSVVNSYSATVFWNGDPISVSQNEPTIINVGNIVSGDKGFIKLTDFNIGDSYSISAFVGSEAEGKSWIPLTDRTTFQVTSSSFDLKVWNKPNNIDGWVIEQVSLYPQGSTLDPIFHQAEYRINDPLLANREMQFYPSGQSMTYGYGDTGWLDTSNQIPEPEIPLLLAFSAMLIFRRRK